MKKYKLESIKTQEDLDVIVKEIQQETADGTLSRVRRKEDLVDLADFEAVQKQLKKEQARNKELYESTLAPKIKEQFLKNGGNEKAFDDIYKNHKADMLDLDEKELGKYFTDLKKVKDYLFTPSNPTTQSVLQTKQFEQSGEKPKQDTAGLNETNGNIKFSV